VGLPKIFFSPGVPGFSSVFPLFFFSLFRSSFFKTLLFSRVGVDFRFNGYGDVPSFLASY